MLDTTAKVFCHGRNNPLKNGLQDQPAPMRVGFTGSLVDGFRDVEWFGRGPHESYLDRHASARVGLFQGTIAEQTFKYVRPQENGNKYQTRWMALKRQPADACSMLFISAQEPGSTMLRGRPHGPEHGPD